MIKFFRKIRQKLIEGGNLKRYLIYAIGEILLVVIGILIALQINNWNQLKLENSKINNAIFELKENLIEDNNRLKALLEIRNGDYNAQKRIIKAFENGYAISDSIQSDLGRVMLIRDFYSIKNGYNTLKEIGMNKTRNKDLRNLIVYYYDVSLPHLFEQYENDFTEFDNVFTPYVRNHFKDWVFGEYGIPRDYQFVSHDNYFLTSLKINLTNCQLTIDAIKNCRMVADEIIELIDNK